MGNFEWNVLKYEYLEYDMFQESLDIRDFYLKSSCCIWKEIFI